MVRKQQNTSGTLNEPNTASIFFGKLLNFQKLIWSTHILSFWTFQPLIELVIIACNTKVESTFGGFLLLYTFLFSVYLFF